MTHGRAIVHLNQTVKSFSVILYPASSYFLSSFFIFRKKYSKLLHLLKFAGIDHVTNFLQGYIDNEENLNDKDSCTNTCSDFKTVVFQRCAPNTPCGNQLKPDNPIRCMGRIHDCQDVNHDDFLINYSGAKNRIMENVKYRNGEINGTPCSNSSCIASSQVSRQNKYPLNSIKFNVKAFFYFYFIFFI